MEDLMHIAGGFQLLEPADRLEYLIDFGRRLPELPERLHALRDAGEHMVHECQAPVFLKVHIETDSLHVYADVPREAPIARGFVSILVLAFHGRSLTSLDPLPDDLLVTLGLRGLLGMQRTHGLSAIYNHLKEAVAG